MCTAPALVPTFLGLTEGMSPKGRARTAYMASLTCFSSLVLIIFCGDIIFKILGIDVNSFRVGGGVLILISAIKMVLGSPSAEATSPELLESSRNPGVVPLGIPLVAGPGLLTAMLVHSQEQTGLQDDLILIAASATLALSVLVCFLLGERVAKVMGSSGTQILQKVMGLFLTAIASEFILTGILEAMPGLAGP